MIPFQFHNFVLTPSLRCLSDFFFFLDYLIIFCCCMNAFQLFAMNIIIFVIYWNIAHPKKMYTILKKIKVMFFLETQTFFKHVVISLGVYWILRKTPYPSFPFLYFIQSSNLRIRAPFFKFSLSLLLPLDYQNYYPP